MPITLPGTGPKAAPATPIVPTHDALVPGSVLAQVLYQVMSGREVSVIPSPPGAGKSTLMIDLTSQLAERSSLHIVVLTPTRRGAIDIAHRLYDRLGDTDAGEPRVYLGMVPKPGENVLPTLVRPSAGVRVTVKTVAGAKFKQPFADVAIIDEAYQATYADLAQAVALVPQLVMVGDPGQIGPVVSTNTTLWERDSDGPHRRAPEAFLYAEDCFVATLPNTYRVGADAVHVIEPLYDFTFGTERPARDVAGLPELSVREVPFTDEFDASALRTVASRAKSYVGKPFTAGGVTRPLRESDICVAVSRSAQVTALQSLLPEAVHVGTADRLQGGQWPVVIAVDPLAGASADGFRTSAGRLCVLLSRHQAHLEWVCDPAWREVLDASEADVSLAREVRERLLGRAYIWA